MPVETLGASDTKYLSIIGGKLAQTVQEGTDGATCRKYDVDGNKGEKWEVYFKNLSGFITNMVFKDTDYGKMFSITIEQDGEIDILSMNTASRYFSDFGRKLPGLDLSKPVTLNPYDFEKNGKQIRGLDIRQDGQKMTDHYYDWDKKKALHGLPEVSAEDKKKYDTDDWKVYFVKVKKFLIKEIEKVKIPTGIDTGSKEIEVSDAEEIFDDNKPPF